MDQLSLLLYIALQLKTHYFIGEHKPFLLSTKKASQFARTPLLYKEAQQLTKGTILLIHDTVAERHPSAINDTLFYPLSDKLFEFRKAVLDENHTAKKVKFKKSSIEIV